MSEKQQFQQKMRAQLDEWMVEVDNLRAKAATASADVKQKIDVQIKELESRIAEGIAKLSELANASEEAWGSIRGGFESAWDSLRSAFKDAASKFKD